MLSSIHPLGERIKGNRYVLTAGAFVVGSTFGGLVLGLVVGFLARPLHLLFGAPGWAALLGGACVAAAVVDLRRPARLWCWRRQVDESWLTEFRGWVYGAGFGFQLGAGVLTIVTSAATYAMLVGVAAQGSVVASVLVGGCFGAARGLGILEAAGVSDRDRLVRVHRRFNGRAVAARRATVGVLLGAGAALSAGVVLLTGAGGA